MVGKLVKLIFKKLRTYKNNIIKFDINLFEKVSGIKISTKEMIKILERLGFEGKKR